MRKPDFSGYATKAGLQCSDGRTIMPNAFEHQDGKTVPLVWQHGHDKVENVLGHAVLENRTDGVYAYGYFNDTEAGKNAKLMVKHGDLSSLSIYANKLTEQAKRVLHGAIREVSLVLSGANPGALIDNVGLQHSDGSMEELQDEAVIYTGLNLEHSEPTPEPDPTPTPDPQPTPAPEPVTPPAPQPTPAPQPDPEPVVQHADDETVQDVYNTFSAKQKDVVHFMIGAALESAAAEHSAFDNEGNLIHQEGNNMGRNVFDGNGVSQGPERVLTHSELETIVQDGVRCGSFKESLLAHAEEYGIEDIDLLFPDPKSVTQTPEWISRRMEWVQDVLVATRKSPFSRIKSTAADITADEARAKGYVKGNKKKDEVLKLLRRVTTPKTIYKKQKLDRDDIIDITDLDVVVWLKAEMRLMLDEEVARGILIGDGRDPDDPDKIDEDHLRPIAYDDDMYAHKVNIAGNVSAGEIIKSVLRTRHYYKGTGTPTFYTTDAILTDLLLLEDKVGRRLYETEQSLAAALRVNKIVPVEVMEQHPDLIGIVVNLVDYTIGADAQGRISMFDDFDIDYNQEKYLIETRISGALTKPKSAVVLTRDVGTSVLPTQPAYNAQTHKITIPTVTGVTYKIDGVTKTGEVTITEDTEVEAFANTGYSFPHNTNTSWTYVY